MLRACRGPLEPSEVEQEEHVCAGHVPYRSWCRACVAGRGRSDAHHDAGGGSAISVIGLDYGYLVKFEDVSAGESPSPILATKCSVAKRVTADVLPCRGVGHPWCVQALVRVLLDAGHVQYRSWCRACVAGRGRSHDAGGGSTIPVIGLDYGYLVKLEDVRRASHRPRFLQRSVRLRKESLLTSCRAKVLDTRGACRLL